MVDMEQRGPWRSPRLLLLIGPGAVGKSSVGAELAPLLERSLIDLDQEFLSRIGEIDRFIQVDGYQEYKLRNSGLAIELANEMVGPTLLVTSSGFLTPDNPPSALKSNMDLLKSSCSICLLPSRDLEQAVSVVVERQLSRSFSADRARAEATIRNRYPVYACLGDLTVYSVASPAEIARAIADRLSDEG